MTLKNKQREKIPERIIRLESKDDGIFKQAYLELKASCEYSKLYFGNTSIYPCLKKQLNKYTPRFQNSSNQPTQSYSSQ